MVKLHRIITGMIKHKELNFHNEGIQYVYEFDYYNSDGSLRQFGIGTKKKTVLPIWLLSLILAIFSYLFVLYYLSFPKIMY